VKRLVPSPGVYIVVLGLLAIARPAAAQQTSSVEVGASLVNVSVVLPPAGGSTVVLFDLPPATFSIFNPAVYLAFLASRSVAVEPQIGLLVFHGGSNSGHLLNVSGQVDYFLSGTAVTSWYVFGRVGVLSASGAQTTPKSIGGGAGYRIRYGDRLVVRITGDVTHFTSGVGNMISFAVSIGGLFGK
jgi:hypothetical protein